MVLALVCLNCPEPTLAADGRFEIEGPLGSQRFGSTVEFLANGNLVVLDPGYSNDRGAAYLYDRKGELISQFTGSSAGTAVGSRGIVELRNGHYLILSEAADIPLGPARGAVTWAHAEHGVTGELSEDNSLIGRAPGDDIGSAGVLALANGNYVVVSPRWDWGSEVDAGAVTWGDGSVGIRGVVSEANSLVGLRTRWFEVNVQAMSDGDYVVQSPGWGPAGQQHFGAATWVDGGVGLSGPISPSNSLVGSRAGDNVGLLAAELSNGNLVIGSPRWSDGVGPDVGAITWVDGDVGASGEVTPDNSLVGNLADDRVGQIYPLTNGHYVVLSQRWKGPQGTRVGAVTWCDGFRPTAGRVTAENSLVGSRTDDLYFSRIQPLSNGNFVLTASTWDHGEMEDVGLIAWASGAGPSVGELGVGNALVGGNAHDRIGKNVVHALSAGGFVVASPDWDGPGATDAGAVSWGDGEGPLTGTVSSSNSLVGERVLDQVGSDGVLALSNGNFVVLSAYWDNGSVVDAGAATWGSGENGVTGHPGPHNSLVGGRAYDGVGTFPPHSIALPNGNYVIGSPRWSLPQLTRVGAITWGDGQSGTVGLVSGSNSVVGERNEAGISGVGLKPLADGNYVYGDPYFKLGFSEDLGAVSWFEGDRPTNFMRLVNNVLRGPVHRDRFSEGGVTPLTDGGYVVLSRHIKDSLGMRVGAITHMRPGFRMTGVVTEANSVFDILEDDYTAFDWDYDAATQRMAVSRSHRHHVVIWSTAHVFASGFDTAP